MSPSTSLASPSATAIGVYIPVHKRNSSSSSSGSLLSSRAPSSSRSVSPARSVASTDSSVDTMPPYIYTPEDLLSLAGSPFARISPQSRDSMRDAVPEIVLNRRQRKALSYKAEHPTSHADGRKRVGRPDRRVPSVDKVAHWREGAAGM